MSEYYRLIEEFEARGQKLRPAVTGLTGEEGMAKAGPGMWSIQELVIHLGGSDAIMIDRMKRIITEDNPALLWAEEDAYVKRLHCDAQSLDDAVTLLDLSRRQFARVLRELDDSESERFGTHNVFGQVTLVGLVKTLCDHLDHHLKFLEARLARLRGTADEPPNSDLSR